ncbi:oxidoreductase [Treponema parvum]|uniref:Oxidoreductase n=1 Tax=Treponema parvum TaxID=138851 RepID=A0A975IC01_9SPIR|nr:nitrogenase component 1 [Treponema parvum]QTQ11247.1 oxidoreductase [Treponema parvum]
MSKLCITLPPLAPDYSGVASALFDMGGMIVIHDASGCTGNYVGYDEPRWMGSKSAVYCSGLRHMDAVLGRDDKYIDMIVKAAESIRPNFFAFLGSPVPMVIGTDYKGIAEEVENITGVPSMGFDTKGLDYYDKGISEALIAVLKKFVPAAMPESFVPKIKAINLVGVTPLDFGNKGNDIFLKKAFEEEGVAVNSVLSMGLTIDSLIASVNSKLNVVVSYSGLDVARFMKKKYGIPFIAGLPLGNKDKSFILRVKELLESVPPVPSDFESNGMSLDKELNKSSSVNILVAGEQVFALAVRNRLLRMNRGFHVDAAFLYNAAEEYSEAGDRVCKNEGELRAMLNSGKYRKVIADPLVGQLIKDRSKIEFYGTPHPALSSKIHWNEIFNYFSSDMEDFLHSIVKK